MNIGFLSHQNSSSIPDLTEIHHWILAEPTLLDTSIESLEESFRSDMAIVMVDGQEPIGYVRFTPILSRKLALDLGLAESFPEVWEISSAIISPDPQYRGTGLYATLRETLMTTVVQRLQDHSLLIMGTTKHIAVYNVLGKAEAIGIKFLVLTHTAMPMIAAFTCVCFPDFGSGFHLSSVCPARVTREQLPLLRNIAKASATGSKIPCIMYVSNEDLAWDMDRRLVRFFGQRNPGDPQRALVEALIALDHYSTR